MEKLRVVDTERGPISYELRRKQVRRVNLRIREDGAVVMSAPKSFSAAEADRLICQKSGWIISKLELRHSAPPIPPCPEIISPEKEQEILLQAVEAVYPLIQPLGVKKPLVRLRKMKSQWGNCHYRQGYITLNRQLARCPDALREYVALHELVHFLQPNHGPGFYALMHQLMPGWQQCRKQLQGYAGLLRTPAEN